MNGLFTIRKVLSRLACAIRGHQWITVIDSVDWSGATIGVAGGLSIPGRATAHHVECRRCHRPH